MTSAAEIPWLEPTTLLIVAFMAFLPKRVIRPASLVWLVLLAGMWVAGFRSSWLLVSAVGLILLLTWGNPPGRKSKVARTLALFLGITAAAFSWLFPLPETPRPAGPYPVGTRTIELPAEGSDHPKLSAQIWYPCIASGPLEPWLPDPGLTAGFPFNRQQDAPGRSRHNAPVAAFDAPFRVVFYEHAWNGHRAENVAQTQDLASRGFVVVAIDHPGQAARIRYADGSIAGSTTPAVPDFSGETAISSFELEAERLIEKREANIIRMKSALSSIGIGGDLATASRWDEVGIFGFSFGGSCAIHLCSRRREFVAGANEDGLYLGDGVPTGPFLFMDQAYPAWLESGPTADETPEQKLVRRAETKLKAALATPSKSRVVLANTRHAAFSDRKFLSRLPIFTRCGSRPAAQVHQEISTAIGGFFEDAMKPPVSGSPDRR